MNDIGWIIVVILLVPALGLLLWVFLASSFVRIPPGQQALLLVRGRPTDTTLGPGWHFVPTLWRRMVERYPAVELSYRAGASGEDADRRGLDLVGAPIPVLLGDRIEGRLAGTVRFRLRRDGLRSIHERYGPAGVFPIVRDEAATAVRAVLGTESFGVEQLYGDARAATAEQLRAVLAERLDPDGIDITAFLLATVDVGRTGDLMAAVSRNALELEYEAVAAELRLARASHDAELGAETGLTSAETWRYREADAWPDLAGRADHLHLALGARVPVTTPVPGVDPPPQPEPEPEPQPGTERGTEPEQTA